MRAPSGNTINDIHDHPEVTQLGEGQSGDWTDFHCESYRSPLNLDRMYITHHQSVASFPGLPCFFSFQFVLTIIHGRGREAEDGEGLGEFIK